MYYEAGKYDIYSLTNPRSLRRGPYRPQAVDSTAILAATPPIDTTRSLQVRDDVRPQVGEGGSIYRTPSGFRSSGEVARSGDTSMVTKPVSIAALLDSADFSLPDTSEFTLKKYRVSFSPDYVARPNIGYTRDNFGRGFYGGSADLAERHAGQSPAGLRGVRERTRQRGPDPGGVRQPEPPDQLGHRASPRTRTTSWSRARSRPATGPVRPSSSPTSAA